nr:IS66 family insertion sequence element accessory protein TnpB [Lacrimispora aerotolerans]
MAEHIFLACGYTDMRKSIDGLSAIVQQNFRFDSFSNSLFLFCGRKGFSRLEGCRTRFKRRCLLSPTEA